MRRCKDAHPPSPETCAVCAWVASPTEMGRKYRAHWGEPEPAEFAALPCVHRGGEAGRTVCTPCGGNVEIKTFGCAVHGRCHMAQRKSLPGVWPCHECRDRRAGPEPLIFRSGQSPGDVLVMSAAIEMLHQQHPGKYRTAVDVLPHCRAIFDNNPHVTGNSEITEDRNIRRIDMQYNLIHQSNQRPIHFLEGYVRHLSEALKVPLELQTNRPFLYLAPHEEKWPEWWLLRQHREPYALIVAGHKNDFTAKFWGSTNYQALVLKLKDRIRLVQVGARGDNHPPLLWVTNLVGKTSTRELIHLARHCSFAVGPSTFLQHICAALQKPYVCLLGGREPVSWVTYPTQVTLATNSLDCCDKGACWKNKTVKIDGDESLCLSPVMEPEPVPACLAVHTPEDVARVCERFLPSEKLTKPDKSSILTKALCPTASSVPDVPGFNSSELRPGAIYPPLPRIAVVIGTYGATPYIHLQLALREKFWPDVPVTVHDDQSPEGDALLSLCERYGAAYLSNHKRIGHAGGDLNVFCRAISWAKVENFDLLVKFSRRWMFLSDWRPELLKLMEQDPRPTYSNVCKHYNFGFRTECVAMHVPSWHAGGVRADIENRLVTNDWLLPERFMHIHAERLPGAGENGFCTWPAMGTNRCQKAKGALWHNFDPPSKYAEVAKELGIEYPPEAWQL